MAFLLISGIAFAQNPATEVTDKNLIFGHGKYLQVNSADNAHSIKIIQSGATPTITTDTGSLVVTNGITATTTGNTTGTHTGAVVAGNNTITSTSTNAAGGSANPLDITSALGIMNGSDDYTGIDINLTNADHTGSNTIQGLDISGITGDAQATETAINIGNGWDVGINAGNSQIKTSGGLDLSGSNINGANQILANGSITSASVTNIGWSIVAAPNQACETTCTFACVAGQDAGAANVLVACNSATADLCICAGAN